MSLISGVMRAAKKARPVLERIASADDAAQRDGSIAVVAGQPATAARFGDVIGVAPVEDPGSAGFAVYPAAADGNVEPMVAGLSGHLAEGGKGRALLVGTRGERRGLEYLLRASKLGVKSTIQTPSLEGAGGDMAAQGLARALGDRRIAAGVQHPLLRPAVGDVIVASGARRAGAVGAVPLPGADLPALVLVQIAMVNQLATLYQHRTGAERLIEAALVTGAAFGWRELARAGASAVPGAGWAVRGAVAYASTRALGEMARLRFAERGELFPEEVDEAVHHALARVTSS